MECKSKSAAIVLFLLLGLSACSDPNNPNMFSAVQIPQDVLNEPRIVAIPENVNNPDVPLLGEVPPKPKDFITKTDSSKIISSMAEERTTAEKLRDQTEQPEPALAASYQPAVQQVLPSTQPPGPQPALQQGLQPPLLPPILHQSPQP